MRASPAALIAMLLLGSCQPYVDHASNASPTGYRFHGYQITGARAREQTRVKRILRDVAAQCGIPQQSPTPLDSPTMISLYRDSRVQLSASRQKGYVSVAVIRWTFSGASAFARTDPLVRSTLAREFGDRLYVEPEPDLSHPIVTE